MGNRDGNTIIFGMLPPYPNHNSIQTEAKNACVCQCVLCQVLLHPDLQPGYFVGRNGAHSPLRQRIGCVGVRPLRSMKNNLTLRSHSDLHFHYINYNNNHSTRSEKCCVCQCVLCQVNYGPDLRQGYFVGRMALIRHSPKGSGVGVRPLRRLKTTSRWRSHSDLHFTRLQASIITLQNFYRVQSSKLVRIDPPMNSRRIELSGT